MADTPVLGITIAALVMLGLALAHTDGLQPFNELKDSLLKTVS